MTTDKDYYRGLHHGVCQTIDRIWHSATEAQRISLKEFEDAIQAEREAICRGESVL